MKNDVIKCKYKNKRFNILNGTNELESLIDSLPNDGECFKFISQGDISSICFIYFVSKHTKINSLYISSFRIGAKEAKALHTIHQRNNLDYVELMTASHFKLEKGYPIDAVTSIFEKNDWVLRCENNHSKVHLYDTDQGKFVIETSSNLNENPNIEQFSFEKDDGLFDFYLKNIFKSDEDECH